MTGKVHKIREESPISNQETDDKGINVEELLNDNYWKSVYDYTFSQLKKGESCDASLDNVPATMKCKETKKAEAIVTYVYEKFGADFYQFDKFKDIEKFKVWKKHFEPNLKRSELSKRAIRENETLEEDELNDIMLEARLFGIKMTKDLFFTLLNSRFVPKVNPIKGFFAKHKELKPEGLIKQLADTLNSPTGFDEDCFYPNFIETMLKRWMIGIVAGVYGHQNNLFLILSGPQNSGKTEFFRRILPKELKPFMAETQLEDASSEADLGMVMAENLIIFDDEMGEKSPRDWAQVKRILQKDVFTIRKPYGKGHERVKRLASFCGTTNSEEILGDMTGNRRYIPIETGVKLKFKDYNSIDKLELWMEAYHLFKNGEKWQLSRDEIKMLNECTAKFEKADEIVEKITQYYRVPQEGEEEQIDELTATQIKSELCLKCNPEKIGLRMTKVGFKKRQTKRDGVRVRLYSVISKIQKQAV